MKELKAPWIHWESPDAHIPPTVFSPLGGMREHPWFAAALDEQGGAFTCEFEVARPSIVRWTRLRFDELAAAGEVADVRRVLEQVVATPAVNIVSSFQRGDVPGGDAVGLPATFFADTEALLAVDEERPGLGIDVAEPEFAVPRDVYDAVLANLGVRVTSGRSFTRPGDTHFAFAVPERAFEDQRAVVEARRIGLLSDRLAASQLMTDFPNPVFSERRARLLGHAPERAQLSDGGTAFADAMSRAILKAAETATADSPEREFAQLWEAGDDWRRAFRPRLEAYFEAVRGALGTREGFEAIYRVAEARRQRMREDMAIVESKMLFSTSKVEEGRRAMREDATVVDLPA